MAVVELGIPPQGITIMDGPFTTLLPYGKSERLLLYDVSCSVVATKTGKTMDPSWRHPSTAPFAGIDRQTHFEKLREHVVRFVPAAADARLVAFLEGPRMVLADCDHDDARPSIITDYGNGYIVVFAGKVDHCVDVAQGVAGNLKVYFGISRSNDVARPTHSDISSVNGRALGDSEI